MELAQQWLEMQRNNYSSSSEDEPQHNNRNSLTRNVSRRTSSSSSRAIDATGGSFPLSRDERNLIFPTSAALRHNSATDTPSFQYSQARHNSQSVSHQDSTLLSSHQQRGQSERDETDAVYRSILDAPLPACLTENSQQQPRGRSSHRRPHSNSRSRDPSGMRMREASTIGGEGGRLHTEELQEYLLSLAARDAITAPVHDQLLAKGKLTAQRKEELVLADQARQAKMMKSPTISKFAKELSEAKKGDRSVPFHIRSAQIDKKKREKLMEAAAAREEEEKKKAEKMFKPKLSAHGKRAQGKVHLFAENSAEWQHRKVHHAVEERTKRLVEDLKTLQDRPMISRRSEQLAQRVRERTLQNAVHSDPNSSFAGRTFGNNNYGGGTEYVDYMMERERQSRLNAWEATIRNEMMNMSLNHNPKITLYGAGIERAPELSVGERLYYDAITMEERRAAAREKLRQTQEEEARKQKQQYRSASATNSPTSRSSSSVRPRRTAADIADDLMNRHLEAMAARSQAVEAALAEPPHRPIINPTSDEIVSRMPESTMERLTRPKNASRHRLSSHQRQHDSRAQPYNSFAMHPSNHNGERNSSMSTGGSRSPSGDIGPTFGEATGHPDHTNRYNSQNNQYHQHPQHQPSTANSSLFSKENVPPGGALVVSSSYRNSSGSRGDDHHGGEQQQPIKKLTRQQMRERELQRQLVLQRRAEKREERMRMLRQEKAAKEMEGCTFHPHIHRHSPEEESRRTQSNGNNNTHGALNTSAGTVTVMVSPATTPRRRQRHSRTSSSSSHQRHQQRTGDNEDDYPPSPHHNPRSATDFFERTTAWAQRCEKQQQMERLKKRQHELDGCTFQPEIHPPPSSYHHFTNKKHHRHSSSSPQHYSNDSYDDVDEQSHSFAVSNADDAAAPPDGVEDFVARLAYARRQREEAAARAAATGSRWERGRLTVPQPFHLSTQHRRDDSSVRRRETGGESDNNNNNNSHVTGNNRSTMIKSLQRPFPMPDPALAAGLNEFLAGMDDDNRPRPSSNPIRGQRDDIHFGTAAATRSPDDNTSGGHGSHANDTNNHNTSRRLHHDGDDDQQYRQQQAARSQQQQLRPPGLMMPQPPPLRSMGGTAPHSSQNDDDIRYTRRNDGYGTGDAIAYGPQFVSQH